MAGLLVVFGAYCCPAPAEQQATTPQPRRIKKTQPSHNIYCGGAPKSIMADLNHLLDELDHVQQQEQQEQVETETTTTQTDLEDDLHEGGGGGGRTQQGGILATTGQEPNANHDAFTTTTVTTSFNDNNNNNIVENDQVLNDNDENDNDDPFVNATVPHALQEAMAAVEKNTTMNDSSDNEQDLLSFESSPSGNYNGYDQDDTNAAHLSNQRQAYQLLQTWWIQEVQAPELLPWQGDLVQGWRHVLEEHQQQQDDLDDDDHDENELVHRTHEQAQLKAFLQGVARIDRQRIQYLLHHLLTVRLHKLQRYHTYYWKQLQQQEQQQEQEPAVTPTTPSNDPQEEEEDTNQEYDKNSTTTTTTTTTKLLQCSPAERDFLHDYHALWKRHMHDTVTQHFPQTAWKGLDDDTDMIPYPNLDEFCWIRVSNKEPIHLPVTTTSSSSSSSSSPYSQEENDNHDDDDDEWARHDPGTILIVPYRAIQSYLHQGKVQLYL